MCSFNLFYEWSGSECVPTGVRFKRKMRPAYAWAAACFELQPNLEYRMRRIRYRISPKSFRWAASDNDNKNKTVRCFLAMA